MLWSRRYKTYTKNTHNWFEEMSDVFFFEETMINLWCHSHAFSFFVVKESTESNEFQEKEPLINKQKKDPKKDRKNRKKENRRQKKTTTNKTHTKNTNKKNNTRRWNKQRKTRVRRNRQRNLQETFPSQLHHTRLYQITCYSDQLERELKSRYESIYANKLENK